MNTWATPRQPIGAAKRERDLAEKREAVKFEQLLNWHRLDFWHCTVAQRSQPGFPDYVIFGLNWLAFVELKARSRTTDRAGRVSVAQERYKASIEAAGAEWRTWLWPDQMEETNDWLRARTHRDVVFQ
jgi:hypothetical protein